MTANDDTTTYAYDADGETTNIDFTVAYSNYTPNRAYSFDPDGRVASVGDSSFGTWTYAYDGNGRLATLAEPATGGAIGDYLPSYPASVNFTGATYQYGYYGNGWLSTVSVSGGASFSSNHSYRSDAMPSNTWFSRISGTISHQYTPAGRLTQRTDPLASEPMTYDSYGRESGATIPGASFSQFQYDFEGDPTVYKISRTGYSAANVAMFYTATDQLAAYGNSASQTFENFYFDGVPVASGGQICSGDGVYCTYADAVVDTLNLLSVGTVYENSHATAYSTFDAGNRIASTSYLSEIDDSQGSPNYVISFGRGFDYDADDHLIFAQNGPTNQSATYVWGANGHPMASEVSGSAYGGSPWYFHSWHWDGNALSFTGTLSGTVDDYKLGLDGDVLAGYNNGYTGSVYLDRDVDGQTIYTHSASGGKPYPPASLPSSVLWSNSSGAALMYNRPDGVTDGVGTIQGVRNTNPDTQQWTTPDAYAGDITDPMSQSAYMWNNNNPVRYQDPSGYCPVCLVLAPEVPAISAAAVAAAAAGGAALGAIAGLIHNAVWHNANPDAQPHPEAGPPPESPAGATHGSGEAETSGHAPTRTPARGEPGTTATFPAKDGGRTERTYGPDGRAETDVDYGHNHGGQGDPHEHDWDWSRNRPRLPGRPPQPRPRT
jgi:YD repeat-containing protein